MWLQGLNVYITVWDDDPGEKLKVPYDLVDEFSFNFTDAPGAQPLVRVFDGVRYKPKSK